jgi:ribosomal protein S21
MKVYVIRDDSYYSMNRKEKEDIFKKSLSVFKKKVSDSGVLQECRKREFYESPGQKRRRKKKESDLVKRKEQRKNNMMGL